MASETPSLISLTATKSKTANIKKQSVPDFQIKNSVDDLHVRIRKMEVRMHSMEVTMNDLTKRMKRAGDGLDLLCEKVEVRRPKVPPWIKPYLQPELEHAMVIDLPKRDDDDDS